jgi:hypothetical protein
MGFCKTICVNKHAEKPQENIGFFDCIARETLIFTVSWRFVARCQPILVRVVGKCEKWAFGGCWFVECDRIKTEFLKIVWC